MAIFHPFPRLPLELRIQIWSMAITENRVLKIRELNRFTRKHFGYWSPTPPPAVTRASQESRKYCSYHKAFLVSGSPHYIWTRFDSDIVQMLGSVMYCLVAENRTEVKGVKRLRIELVIHNGFDARDESEFFFHKYSHHISAFPRLEACDVLVNDGLTNWTSFIDETYWGACPKSNVRFIDARTGAWIDEETDGPYQDWIDTGRSYPGNECLSDYNRIDDDWDEDDPVQVEERFEAMMRLKGVLPRIEVE